MSCALLVYTALLLSSKPLQAAATCDITLLLLLLLLVAAAAMLSRISRTNRLYPLIRPNLLLLLLLSSVLDLLRVRLLLLLLLALPLLLLVAFFAAAFPPFLGFSCVARAYSSTRLCPDCTLTPSGRWQRSAPITPYAFVS
jgi:hypothetical protein